MPKSPSRAARIAMAATAVVALGLGTTACSFATLDDVAPGQGVNTSSSGVHVMNVVLLGKGSDAQVVASVQTPTDDTLVSVGGTPLNADGSAATAYTTATVNVSTPANTLVNLDSKNLTMGSSASKPGLTAQVTFTFQKAGAITVTAPIMDPDDPVYSPSPSAQG